MAVIVTVFMTVSAILTLLICRAAGRASRMEEKQERLFLHSNSYDLEDLAERDFKPAQSMRGSGRRKDYRPAVH